MMMIIFKHDNDDDCFLNMITMMIVFKHDNVDDVKMVELRCERVTRQS